MSDIGDAGRRQPELSRPYLLTVFVRILAIGVLGQVANVFVAPLSALSDGVVAQVMEAMLFGGVLMAPLYFWVVKDIGRRLVIHRREHHRLAETARAQAAAARADQAQLALQAYVDTVVASVPSALLLVSTDLIVQSVSQSFRDLFNIGNRDVVGQPVEKVLPLSGVWKLVAEILGSDDPNCKVSVGVSDPGRDRDFHVTLARLPQPDHDARLLLVIEDVTERKRLLAQVEASRARFWGIVNAASDAILSVDEGQRVVIFNQHAEEMFGYSASEIIGQPLDLLLPAQFREGHRGFVGGFQYEPGARRAMSQRPILLGLRKSGEEFPVEITISRLLSDGKVLMTAIVRDVSERRRMERDLRTSQAALQTFLDNASDLVQTIAADGRFVYVNRAWLRTLGYQSEETASLTLFDVVPADDRPQYQDFLQRVIAGEALTNIESTLVAKDGRRVPVEGHLSCAVRDDQVVAWAIFRDVAERKAAEARLNHLAHHDSLTGLPNRLLFTDRLTQALAQARRAKHLVGLLFLDLDGFKAVNDRFGHETGDMLLKAVAQRLIGSVRSSDTIARLGGDEFTVILHSVNRVEGAAVVAAKILDALAQPFPLEGHQVSVTTSIGIAVYPSDSETVEGLLKNADAAMYRAKAQGDTYQFFAPDTQKHIVDRLASASDLRQAFGRRALVVRYRPYLALATRRLVGALAHVQWTREARVVPQAELMRAAGEAGLLAPLTQWLLRTACTDACAWQSPGFPPVRVGVYLSRQQFVQAHVVGSVEQALRESGLESCCLDLELDEGIFLLEAKSTAVTLRALRGLGLTLSIADFGTGYSSLGDLKQFAIDGLRIGRDLLNRVTTDPDPAAVVRGIIAMAHELKMRVVAEGVENEAQAIWLQAHHCDVLEGDLVAGPLSADAFRRMREGVGGSEWQAE